MINRSCRATSRHLYSHEQTVVRDGERTHQGEDEGEAERCTQGGYPQGSAQDSARQAAAAPVQPSHDGEAAGPAWPCGVVACQQAEASQDALAGNLQAAIPCVCLQSASVSACRVTADFKKRVIAHNC